MGGALGLRRGPLTLLPLWLPLLAAAPVKKAGPKASPQFLESVPPPGGRREGQCREGIGSHDPGMHMEQGEGGRQK